MHSPLHEPDENPYMPDDDCFDWPPGYLQEAPRYRRLLVLVGDAPCSQAPLAYALHLADRLEADIHFLRILAAPMAWGMPDLMATAALDAVTLKAYGEGELCQAAAVAEAVGIPYTMSLRWGSPCEVIQHTTRLRGCDLIVMGRSMPAGLAPISAPYLARRVADQVGQPVLVVPPSFDVASQGVSCQRALLVIHDVATADIAVSHVLALEAAVRTTLCLLRLASPSPGRAAEQRAASALAAAQATAARVPFDLQQATGNVPTAILRTAVDQQCDIVMLSTSMGNVWSRLLHGCPAKAVLDHAEVPVLLIPSA